MITFESPDQENYFLVCRHIFRADGSSWYMKVIGSGSRLQEQKSVKCDSAPGWSESMTATAAIASPFQSFRLWCYQLPACRLVIRACSTACRCHAGSAVVCIHLTLLFRSGLARCAGITFLPPTNRHGLYFW